MWSRIHFRILKECVYLDTMGDQDSWLLAHVSSHTCARAPHTVSGPLKFAAHTSVSDPDLERASLDTTGDQDSVTYPTARFSE